MRQIKSFHSRLKYKWSSGHQSGGWLHQYPPFVPDDYRQRVYDIWQPLIGARIWWEIQVAHWTKLDELPVTPERVNAAAIFEEQARVFLRARGVL